MFVCSMQYTREIITSMSKMNVFLGTIRYEIRILAECFAVKRVFF